MVADLCHFVLNYRVFGRIGEKAPREYPPSGDFFVFSHGDFSPRHTKVRHVSCVAFSLPVCRIFARRGERSPRENHHTVHVCLLVNFVWGVADESRQIPLIVNKK